MTEPIWAEINLSAIAHNVRAIRNIVRPEAKVMAVVKANGYGHGAVPVAKTALANGADRLAVARVGEAVKLREAGIDVPILVLGYTTPDQMAQMVAYDLTQTIYDYDLAEALNQEAARQGRKALAHLKVDTGMGRIGLVPALAASVQEALNIARLPHLALEGIFTHFATADEHDKTYTRQQFDGFLQFIAELSKQGLTFPVRHCANSATIMDLPEMHLDMVRPGIILYGLYPSEAVDKSRLPLEPAMSVKTRVTYVKSVPAGFKISYGSTYTTPTATVIASLPLGYADGYSRLLSSRGEVLIHGQLAPIVGRVCMDQSMVDVGRIPDVQIGDEVVVFGRQGEAVMPVEKVAAMFGTINYELVCLINERVPRIYL